MDMQRWGFAEPPDHKRCKMRRRRRVAFHISDKTLFSPHTARVPSNQLTGLAHATQPETSGSTCKCRLPANRPTRIGNIAVATTTPFSSWDFASTIIESQSGRAKIRQ